MDPKSKFDTLILGWDALGKWFRGTRWTYWEISQPFFVKSWLLGEGEADVGMEGSGEPIFLRKWVGGELAPLSKKVGFSTSRKGLLGDKKIVSGHQMDISGDPQAKIPAVVLPRRRGHRQVCQTLGTNLRELV